MTFAATVSIPSTIVAEEPTSLKTGFDEKSLNYTGQTGSLQKTGIEWPSLEQLVRVLSLRDYNTRIVLMGTTLLGICAGLLGTFMLLRRQALIGDVVGHAALPGVAVAFLIMESWSAGTGKNLVGLYVGATISGASAVLLTFFIRRFTRTKTDAAMAISLSFFFGIGVCLFVMIQSLPTGNASGLRHFIFGKGAALMVANDVKVMASITLVTVVLCLLLFKEFSLLCFDEQFASVQGWPVAVLDLLLLIMIVAVTIAGMQSVGLLLVVALPIIPASAARFWTDDIRRMAYLSAFIGGSSSLIAAVVSTLIPRLSTGPVIVLMGTLFFAISMLFGVKRGLLLRYYHQLKSTRRVGRHDLLRACFEYIESVHGDDDPLTASEMTQQQISCANLLPIRSWSLQRLNGLIKRAIADELMFVDSVNKNEIENRYRLTKRGALESFRITRNHRLWETYLMAYADIAPGHVDRDADQIEHVLEPALIDELEQLMSTRYPDMSMPPSPHRLELSH